MDLKRNRSKDEFVVRELKDGSEKAFKKIYEHYLNDIFSYSLALVRSEEAAEEIVQEVFLRLWLNAETLVPELSLRSYLFTIARNLSFDFLRKAANSRKLREEIFYSGSALHDRTQEELIHAEYDLLRKKAIETLPPKRRRIYTLSREEGMSYEDISRELGISISTVKTQMSKALQSMKEYLQLNTDLTFLLALALQIGADWNF